MTKDERSKLEEYGNNQSSPALKVTVTCDEQDSVNVITRDGANRSTNHSRTAPNFTQGTMFIDERIKYARSLR